MNKAVEMALCFFYPRGGLTEVTYGTAGLLDREDFLGALQFAAKDNPLGLKYLMADHLLDKQAILALKTHFCATLGNDEVGSIALAILLRRPLPEQLDRLVFSHPHYDKERRRAAVVMEKAKRAHRAGNDHEYQRLLAERNEILRFAHDFCVDEMLQTGRCPSCSGTGRRQRIGDECPKCNGTGRVVPDLELVSRQFGSNIRQSLARAVDEVLHQASALARVMDQQVREMRAISR